MLEPDKFKEKEIAQNLVRDFEKIGVPDIAKNSISKIKQWTNNQRKGFKNKKDLMSQLKNQDLTNERTLNYFSQQLQNTNNDLILDVFFQYKEENVKKVISYYLVNELRFKRRFPEKLKKITEDKAYIKVMTEFIEKYDIRTQQAKDFLSKNGKYDLLAKFNRR
jgi:hypothetical protein